MKEKKAKWIKIVPALVLVAVVAVFATTLSNALAFEGYEIEKDNDLVIEVKNKKASSTATVKYKTGNWYLFPDLIEGATELYESVSKWEEMGGIKITLRSSDIFETVHQSENVYYDYYRIPAEEIVPAVLEWFTDEDGNITDREKLMDGVDVFASRSLKVYYVETDKTMGPYFCYETIAKQANWSKGALSAFETSYDKPVRIEFNGLNFNIEVVDENGEAPTTYDECYNDEGIRLYGETLESFSYPGALDGYTYEGYELVATYGKTGEDEVVISGTSGKTKTYKILLDDSEGEYDLTLRFIYRSDVEIPDPTLTNTPTPTPEPTLPSDVSPTPTTTPVPTSTPAPTPQPSNEESARENYEYWFTTDAGFTMDQVAGNTEYYLAGKTSSIAAGRVSSATETARTVSYSTGTDAKGNQWYFYPSGTNATFVHPAVYNGYNADSSDVRYITELTFPSTITSGSTTYTVTGIGGGTPKYHALEVDDGVNDEWAYYRNYGYYDYESSSGSSTVTDKYNYITYAYGVLGNGYITSYGGTEKTYTSTGGGVKAEYYRNYYVYNTTLKSITIPDTVTEISEYAFAYCQALEEIKGGAGVKEIEKNAFAAGSTISLQLCDSIITYDDDDVEVETEYYFYNNSCARYVYTYPDGTEHSTCESGEMTEAHKNCGFYKEDYTDIMLNCRERSKVTTVPLTWPEFPVLQILHVTSFSQRSNLYEVALSDTVTEIKENAFYKCALDSIEIPSLTTEVDGDSYDTLGTNGTGEFRTIIYTVPGAEVIDYGRTYGSYYRLKFGYNITYKPNGPEDGDYTQISDVNFASGDYVFASSFDDSAQYTYAVAVERNGDVWRRKSASATEALLIGSIGSFGSYVGTLKSINSANNSEMDTGYIFTNADGDLYFVDAAGGSVTLLADGGTVKDVSFLGWIETKTIYGSNGIPTGVQPVAYNYLYYLTTDNKLYYFNGTGTTLVSSTVKQIFDRDAAVTDSTYGSSILYAIGTDNVLYNVYGTSMVKVSNVTLPSGVEFRYFYFTDYNKAFGVDTDGDIWTKKNKSSSWAETACGMGEVNVAHIKGTEYYLFYNDTTAAKSVYLPGSSTNSAGVTITDYTLASPILGATGQGTGSVQNSGMSGNWIQIPTDTGNAYIIYTITDRGFLCKLTSNSQGRITTAVQMLDGKKVKELTGYTGSYDEDEGCTYAFMAVLDESGKIWSTGDREYGANDTELGTLTDNSSLGTFTGIYFDGNQDKLYALTTGGVLGFAVADGYLNMGFVRISDNAQLLEYNTVITRDGAWRFYQLADTVSELKEQEFYMMDHGYTFSAKLYGNPFTYSGHKFTGWNTKADGTGTAYEPGQLLDITADLTLYAQWEKTKTKVSFDANGGTGSMATVELEDSVTTLTLPSFNFNPKDGYKRKDEVLGAQYCWNTKPDGSGTWYKDGATVTGITTDLTLYAQWEPVTVNYTLIYMKYPYGSAENEAWRTVTLRNSLDSDGRAVYTRETVKAYPHDMSEYTVSYDLNKPSGMSSTPSIPALTQENTMANAAVFYKWQLYRPNGDGTQKATSTYFAEGEVVYKLTEEDGAVLYLYPDLRGSGVVLPEAEAEGYTFKGWSETADGSTKIYPVYGDDTEDVGTYMPSTNTTLYAIWTPKTKTVSLDATNKAAAAEGMTAAVTSPQTSATITYDAKAPAVTAPICNDWTFKGYYTKLDADGALTADSIKVYDAVLDADGKVSGVVVMNNKNGTFDAVDTLYAYWLQNPVNPPEPTPTPTLVPTPTPFPEEEWEDTVNGGVQKGLLYADDYNPETGALDDLQPYLVYDSVGIKGAIPGTEQLAFRAQMSAWMLHYKLRRVSGTDMVRVYVTVPYRTRYERAEDKQPVISELQTATYSFLIPKNWCYWEVTESGFYYPDYVLVKNEAIKGGAVSVKVQRGDENSLEALPDYEVIHYEGKEEHVRWEETDNDGTPMLCITLQKEEYIISGTFDREPEVDSYLSAVCYNAAMEDKQQASVRSDILMFAGEHILSDVWQTDGMGEAPVKEWTATEEKATPVTSYLQTYLSGIELEEAALNGIYETYAEIVYTGDEQNISAEKEKRVVIEDINDITVHTPVICSGEILDGVQEYADGLCLELKDALNFFTLFVSNEGIHRMSLGYGEKEFTYALSGKSNLAVGDGKYLNQVRFPFDVYVDEGNDSLHPDGQWNTTGDYLLPAGIWLTTGVEPQRFYLPVTAPNGEYTVEFRSVAINCPTENVELQIQGNTEEHANISPQHYVATDTVTLTVKSYLKDFCITGTEDAAAEKMLKAGCQALTLKKGYGFSYALYTQGEFFGENAEIKIIPGYFWEPEDGSKRQEVSLYRADTVLSEITRECYAWDSEPLLLQQENFDVIRQCFLGKGRIPADVLCVSKADSTFFEEYVKVETITGKEDFIKQNGYLVIQFEIWIKSNENRWYEFDRWLECELAEDAITEGWKYVLGDIIRYDLSKSIREDYEVGGVE